MPKMKVNMGTPAAPNWVVMDAKDALTLQGKSAADFSLVGHGHTFSSLTSIPTTLTGYGISDNVVISEANSIKPRWDPTLGAIRMKVDTTDNLPVALAKAVNGIEFRMNAGILEYNDGAGWKQVAGSAVKSVQRGVASVSVQGSSAITNITISSVDRTKSFILVDMTPTTTASGSYDSLCAGDLTSNTVLAISTYAQVAATYNVYWQVIEYA